MKLVKVVGTILAVFVILAGCLLISGCTGEQGVGIESTVDNDDGTFTINYTDGTSFTTSNLTGPQGEQGPRGVAGGSMDWQGAWAVSTSYSVDDAVENDGSSYLCIQGHTSTASDEPGVGAIWETYWSLFAQAGEQGLQGEKGDTGDTGPQGEKGDKGDTGDTGPQGVPGPNMIIAAGLITSAGNPYPGKTYNVDNSWWDAGSQSYAVDLSFYYSFTNYVTLITANGYPGASYSHGGGRLYVSIYDTAGNKVQSAFSFIVLDTSLA